MRPLTTLNSTSTRFSSLAVFLLCLATAIYRIVTHIHANTDLLSHLAFGRFLVDHRTIPIVDTLSFTTTGLPWINHEWLAQVIAYLAFSLPTTLTTAPFLPAVSLITLTILLPASATYTVIYRHCHHRSLPLPTTAGLVFLVILLTALPFSSGRPYVYTFFLLTCLLQILMTYDSSRNPTAWTIPSNTVILPLAAPLARCRLSTLWIIPLLMALWANLHPGFTMGLALLILWAGIHLTLPRIMPTWYFPVLPARPILLLVFASTLATLCTPFTWRLWQHILLSSSLNFDYLTEWTPIALRSTIGFSYTVFGVTASLLYITSPLMRHPFHTTLLTVLLPLPFLAMRHLPISVLLITLLVIPHLAAWLSTRTPVHRGTSNRPLIVTSLAIATLLFAATIRSPYFRCLSYPPISTKAPYPIRAMQLLRLSHATGLIALPFDWSPPVLWFLSPTLQPSSDIRRDWPTGLSAIQTQLRFEHGTAGWDTLLNTANLALVKRKSPTEQLLLLTPNWHLVYQDSLASLFLPTNSPLFQELHTITPPDIPDDGKGQCIT